ncbi:unnamed protein product [Rhizophagus irregularis]|nr:unnamed protein product [Rhizophagus irregularis]CAB4407063.1 unnamed protein product [Rhizophagus irregularis]
MSKQKEYSVSLISAGELIDNLHYGQYAREWRLARLTTNNNIPFYTVYPIRLVLCNNHAGPLVMRFDIPHISETLLSDVHFRPFAF